MNSRTVLLVCYFAVQTVAASEYETNQKYDLTSYNDVTSRDMSNEEQELDSLLNELVEDKERQTGATIQCYTCASTESWEDCERQQVLVGCPADTAHCITATITLDNHEGPPVTEYFKSCVSSEKCYTQHFPACKAGSKESAKCSVECCDMMYCNKGQNQPEKRSFSFHCKPPCLVYGTLHEINGIELKSSRKVPGLTSLSHVTPIDVDMATRTLYWSDKKDRVIKRTDLASGMTDVVIGGERGVYDGIAVEWASRLLYWTDKMHKRIETSRLNGSSRRILVDTNLDKPRAIVVDPEQGVMFWTDWSDVSPRIERSSLSGHARQVLVSTNIRWPNGLVLDYVGKKVYFSESELHRIASMNYDGSGRRVLYSDSTILPFDLALFKTTLFWSDWSSRSIEKLDVKTGKGLGNFGTLTSDRIAGVAVLDPSRQPPVKSRCAVNNGGCSHLCFATGIQTRVCGCPNGVKLLADKRTCDLATTASPRLQVRLVGGAVSSEGRVEVRYNGRWGTICDDLWDLRDAMVICHMLGYPGAISEFHHGYFGRGSGPIWLDDVNCIGDESSIVKCRHPGWGVHNCMHVEDAGVKCRPLYTEAPAVPVRLVNGRDAHEGRVEVRHNGQWGTVCDDLWSKKDADVICRMLGYPGAIAATLRASFGRGTGPIWLDNVRCRGSELSIDECDHQGWGRSNCQHSEDAGVICQPIVHVLPTISVSPAPLQGFAIICLPHKMYIRISRQQLERMTSYHFDPDLLHLNDPSCGVTKATTRNVILGTPLNACGTERRQIGDSLTFTNKVVVGIISSSARRFVRSTPFEIPFRCSYMKTNRRRMLAPPTHAYGHIGQW